MHIFLFLALLCSILPFYASPSALLSVPPTELAPLLARKGYYYTHGTFSLSSPHNGSSKYPFFQGQAYACFTSFLGAWGHFQVGKKSEYFALGAGSLSYSYLYHSFFDFIDTNIRIGLAHSSASSLKPFLHVAHAYGMFYWLDIGVFVSLYPKDFCQNSCIGIYIKADHLVNHISAQLGIEYDFRRKRRECIHLILEYDIATYTSSHAPIIQWWYRWYPASFMYSHTWAFSAGINGCWSF